AVQAVPFLQARRVRNGGLRSARADPRDERPARCRIPRRAGHPFHHPPAARGGGGPARKAQGQPHGRCVVRNRRGSMMADEKPKLLIVEDDEGLQAQLKWAYEDFDVVLAGDRSSAIAALRAEEPPVVTLDLGLPPDPDGTSEGFAVLEEIMTLRPETKVIVASGHGARESALQAIERGAYDFYQKPVDIEQLGLIVRRALNLFRIEEENRKLQGRSGDGNTVLGGLITAAPEMVRVARTIERVANTNVSVMLLGASGTGKELLARGVHDASDRRKGAFVAINCAAIPETLLESELFGHEKGAFTGAVKMTEGKIEQASGGTLFLDEVGD